MPVPPPTAPRTPRPAPPATSSPVHATAPRGAAHGHVIESVPAGLPGRRDRHHAQPAAVHAGSSPPHGSDAGILLPATDKTLVAGCPSSTVGYPESTAGYPGG